MIWIGVVVVPIVGIPTALLPHLERTGGQVELLSLTVIAYTPQRATVRVKYRIIPDPA